MICGLRAVVVVCVVYVPLKLLLVRSLSGKQTIVIHEKHQLDIALTLLGSELVHGSNNCFFQ